MIESDDKRFGKRRLADVDVEQIDGLYKKFYTIWQQAESKE